MTFKPGDRVRVLHDSIPPLKGPSRIGQTGVVRAVQHPKTGLSIDVELNGRCYWFREAELSRVVAWP